MNSLLHTIGVIIVICLASIFFGAISTMLVTMLDPPLTPQELIRLFAGVYTFLGAFYYLTKG